MTVLGSRPAVLVLGSVVSAALYLGYLWSQSRQQQGDQEVFGETSVKSGLLDSETVSQRLVSIQRRRLETLEEEPSGLEEADSGQADPQDETVTEENKVSEERTEYGETENPEEILDIEPVIEEIAVSDDMAVESCAVGPVPDALSALQDPLCPSSLSPASPHSTLSCYSSSSPVKSEISDGKASSCEWSDLIEQDEKELAEFRLDSRVLSSKLSGLELAGRSGDSGVASPHSDTTLSPSEDGGSTTGNKGKKSRTESGEDAGIGSEQGDTCDLVTPSNEPANYEDAHLFAFHFHIPDYMCGKLIGANGAFIKQLKDDCSVNIMLKEREKKKKSKNKKDIKVEEFDIKLVCIEGTRSNIDKCLDRIKRKFEQNPEVTFEQVNRSKSSKQLNLNGSVCLSLAEGVMHDVFVSSIVSGGHVFLQQPYHPTYFALERLDQCMTRVYSQFSCPPVLTPVQLNSVAAAPCEGGWYRAQVVAYDTETEMCDIKYLDYGGYHSLPASELRQIRTDFLSLPFQAIECYLANIAPVDDENLSAFALEELISAQVVQARMIGTNDQGVPMIHLYRAVAGQTTMVNRELVDRNCAEWLDTTIVKLESPAEHPSINWSTLGNFQNRNLGPDPWQQVSPIYFYQVESSQPPYPVLTASSLEAFLQPESALQPRMIQSAPV